MKYFRAFCVCWLLTLSRNDFWDMSRIWFKAKILAASWRTANKVFENKIISSWNKSQYSISSQIVNCHATHLRIWVVERWSEQNIKVEFKNRMYGALLLTKVGGGSRTFSTPRSANPEYILRKIEAIRSNEEKEKNPQWPRVRFFAYN